MESPWNNNNNYRPLVGKVAFLSGIFQSRIKAIYGLLESFNKPQKVMCTL